MSQLFGASAVLDPVFGTTITPAVPGLLAGITIPAWIGPALTAASTIIGAVSLVQQGQAQRAAGEAQARAAQHQAQLNAAQAQSMEQAAGQERAAAQRGAIEEQRKGRLVASRAQTVAAASGAGALDPTIVNILGDIGGEADFRAATALYQGEERARGLEYGAVLQRASGQGDIYAGEVARRTGRAAAGRSYTAAGGTLLRGGATLLSRGRGLDRYAREVPFEGATYYG